MRDRPDQKLKAAMEEIKSTLRKFDICACVVLSSPDAMEYLTEVEASWTCARMNHDTGELRISSKELPAEKKRQIVTDTIGMTVGFLDSIDRLESNLRAVVVKIGQAVSFDHITKEL